LNLMRHVNKFIFMNHKDFEDLDNKDFIT